jgi:hypothetical protein
MMAAAFGVVPGMTFDFRGKTSSFVTCHRRTPPAFEIHGTSLANRFVIVRLKAKKDHRELTMLHGGFMKMAMGAGCDAVVDTILEETTGTYTLTPREDLPPGEYLITAAYGGAMSGILAEGYDFTIKGDNKHD